MDDVYRWNVLYSYMAIDNISNKIQTLLYRISSQTLSTFLELQDVLAVQAEITHILRKEIDKDGNIMDERIFMHIFEKIIEYLLGNVIDSGDERLIGLMNQLYRVVDGAVAEINRLILSISFYTYTVDKDAKRNYDLLCETGKEEFNENKKRFMERLDDVDILGIAKLYEEYVLYYKNEVKRSIMYVKYEPDVEPEKFWNQFFTYKRIDYRNYPATFKKMRNTMISKFLIYMKYYITGEDNGVSDIWYNEIESMINTYFFENEYSNAILFNNYYDMHRLLLNPSALRSNNLIVLEFIRNVIIYNFQYESYYNTINELLNFIVGEDEELSGTNSTIVEKRINIISKIITPKIEFIQTLSEIIGSNDYFANYAEGLMDMIKYESDYNKIYRWLAVLDKLQMILERLNMIGDPIAKDDYRKKIMEALKSGDKVVEMITQVNKDIIKEIGNAKTKQSEVNIKKMTLEQNNIQIEKMDGDIARLEKNNADIDGELEKLVAVDVSGVDIGMLRTKILNITKGFVIIEGDRKKIPADYKDVKLEDIGDVIKKRDKFEREVQLYDLIQKYVKITKINKQNANNKTIAELKGKIDSIRTANELLSKDIQLFEIEFVRIPEKRIVVDEEAEKPVEVVETEVAEPVEEEVEEEEVAVI